MDENYKCGMACLQEQVEEQKESLRRQAETEREIFRRRQDIHKELDELDIEMNKLGEDSTFFEETIGLLYSYSGKAVQNPFAREAEGLQERRRALAEQEARIPAALSELLEKTEAALRRYTKGADLISGCLEDGGRQEGADGFGGVKGKGSEDIFAGNDILAYASRIACPEGRTKTGFYKAFLNSPEYGKIPEGREKRCLDGILIRNLCTYAKEEAERWEALPLDWDPDCRIGDEFTFAYRLREAGLFSAGLFKLGASPQKENLFDYFSDLAEGRVSAAADEIMRPIVGTKLRDLLNPAENQDFFSDVEEVRRWGQSAAFQEYQAIMEEELNRGEKKRRITNLLRMTLEKLIRENSFGEIEDRDSFIKLLTDQYFQGTLDAYLKEAREGWRIYPSTVWHAVFKSPRDWVENEAWFESLKNGEPTAVFRYFETGMYVGECNQSRQTTVLEGLRKMLTAGNAGCMAYLEKLGKWKGERDFWPYEEQVILLENEEAFREGLRRSLVKLYWGSETFTTAVSNVGNQKRVAEDMADLYMGKRLNLQTGNWNISSEALGFIRSEDGQRLIKEQKEAEKRQQEKKAQEKQRNKMFQRLRSEESAGKEDIYWYFDEGLKFQKPDKSMVRVIRLKLAEILNAELPASEETLGRLRNCRSHSNFQPFNETVKEALQKNRAGLQTRCRNALKQAFQAKLTGSAAEKNRVAEALANQYLAVAFEQYMREWNFDTVAMAGKAVKWLETEPAQKTVREEKEKAQQEIQKQEQEKQQREAQRLRMAEQQAKAKEEKDRLERKQKKAEKWREADGKIRQKFDYIDLVLVLLGATNIWLYILCLGVVEVKGILKNGLLFMRCVLFYVVRMALMIVVAMVFHATGGYTLFSVGLYGYQLGVNSAGIWELVMQGLGAALMFAIPAAIVVLIIRVWKETHTKAGK